MTERWRAVVGCEGFYEVSNLGRVRSLDRIDNGGRKLCGSPMRTPLAGRAPNAYPSVALRAPGATKPKRHKVHRLVLCAFAGPPADGQEGCHNNGVKTDNRLVNLRWDTRSENRRDGVVNGERKSKLGSREAVHRMFAMYSEGVNRMEIARRFGLSRSYVGAILDGRMLKRWAPTAAEFERRMAGD